MISNATFIESAVNSMTTPDVAVYCRPWFSQYYKVLAKALNSGLGLRAEFFGDYPGKEGVDLRELCVKKYYKKPKLVPNYLIDCSNDIIRRDRLLRTLTVDEAKERVQSYFCSIQEYFNNRNIQCVISATVDQYVVDLIYLYCVKNRIPFIGYHLSLLPGYTLITARGEANAIRQVEEEEIIRCVKLVMNSRFRPHYIPLPGKLQKAGLNRYLKNIARVAYFSLRSIAPTSKLNYHIESSLSEAKRMTGFHFLRAIYRRFPNKVSKQQYLYLPLQFHPECNSEYWTREDSYIEYEDLIIASCKRLLGEFHIVVKEHPNMVGLRSNLFYSKLEGIGCEVVHPECDHRELIDGSVAVLTLNSSAGIEALCHSKVVICLSRPYYASSAHLVVGSDRITREMVSKYSEIDFESALREAIRIILAGSLPMTMQDIWLKNSKEQMDRANESAAVFAKNCSLVIKILKNELRLTEAIYTANNYSGISS